MEVSLALVKVKFFANVRVNTEYAHEMYVLICERVGAVRSGAVNHVRRGTEQH